MKLMSSPILQPVPEYPESKSALCLELREGAAIAVHFDKIGRDYFPSPESIRDYCKSFVEYSFLDGIVQVSHER